MASVQLSALFCSACLYYFEGVRIRHMSIIKALKSTFWG